MLLNAIVHIEVPIDAMHCSYYLVKTLFISSTYKLKLDKLSSCVVNCEEGQLSRIYVSLRFSVSQ